MVPLNEKERTNAFIQFIALFTLTLILVAVYVLMNGNMYKKERDVLRTEIKSLKENPSNNNSQLAILVDTLKKSISGLDKLDNANFSVNESMIRSELINQLIIKGDSGDIARIRQTIKDICDKWIIDKSTLITNKSLQSKITEKDESIKTLKGMLIQKGVQPETLDLISK